MRKISLVLAGAFLGVGSSLLATQTHLLSGTSAVAASAETYRQLSLFGDVFEKVRTDYVEKPDEAKLIEAAVNGMLTSLDPHSSYMDSKSFRDMQVQTKGEFGGLGIEVTQENGFVKVVSPMDGTPADRAGIKAGDLITQVNGESVAGLPLDQAVDLMRGPVGSEIKITIARPDTAEPFDVTMKRETITIAAVRSRVEDDTVVLRVTTFNEQTYESLEKQLKEQVEAAGGMDKVAGFVLDLRNNPGGLLTQAIAVSDAFLNSGEVVSTRGRDPQDSERYNATEGDLAQGKPLVVVINGGSASASEIVAGALQDHRRAIVVGTQSFGKGSVQTVMPVQGDGGMRLTTARYYTPSGRSIQSLGVAPDIIVDQKTPEEAAADTAAQPAGPMRSEADLRGSLTNDSLTEDEKKTLEEDRKKREETARLRAEDYQMSYALDILHGLSVLNGGTN